MRGASALLGLALALVTASCTSMPRLGVHSEDEAAQLVLRVIEKHHYSRIRVDDQISRATLENYLALLDGQRLYFTNEEVESFRSRYGNLLDEAVRQGRLDPAREIYDLYQRRLADCLEFTQNFLKARPDVNTSRQWIVDRSQESWPDNRADLDELWQDWARHQLIDLILEERSYEAARALLHRRNSRAIYDGRLTSGFRIDPFMDALARAFDHYASFGTVSSAGRLSDDGSSGDPRGDIGLYLENRELEIVVAKVVQGSPAALHGIEPGDRVVGMDVYENGEFADIAGWKAPDVAELLLGPVGTAVNLRILPKSGETDAYEARILRIATSQLLPELPRVSRARAFFRKLSGSLVGSRASKNLLQVGEGDQSLNIGVIRLASFKAGSARHVQELTKELIAQGMQGLVLDLRWNAGGRVDETVRLAGMFVGKGPIHQFRDRKGNVRVLRNRRQPVIWDGPLAVLVNGGTVSASEAFAAAIQDYGAGLLVGQRTMGKGIWTSWKTRFTISVRSGERISSERLQFHAYKGYRVTGTSVHYSGVEPDIELPAAGRSWPLRWWPGQVTRFSITSSVVRDPLQPDEIPAAEFKHPNTPFPKLDMIRTRHKKRVMQDAEWKLMENQINLMRRSDNRRSVHLNLDQRRVDQAASTAEEVRIAQKWLEENGFAANPLDPAQEKSLWQTIARNELLPTRLSLAANEPELLRVLALTRGYVFLPIEDGYAIKDYDLPLQQTASIVADMARMQEDGALASVATLRSPGAGSAGNTRNFARNSGLGAVN